MKRVGKSTNKRPSAGSAPTVKRPAAHALKRPASASTMTSKAHEAAAEGPSGAFRQLLDKHLLESMYKQCHLESVVEGRTWSLCLDPAQPEKYGKLCFGEDLAFECQLLGSESFQSNTWQWAWANPTIPSDLAQAANSLRFPQTGRETQHEFTEPQLPLSTVSGHQIAAVVTGMIGAPAYYSGPTGGGAGRIYMAITDPNFPARTPETSGDVLRLLRCIGQALDTGWLSTPAAAVDAFVRRHGAEALQDGGYTFPGGGAVKMEVDEEGRLRSITSNLVST